MSLVLEICSLLGGIDKSLFCQLDIFESPKGKIELLHETQSLNEDKNTNSMEDLKVYLVLIFSRFCLCYG